MLALLQAICTLVVDGRARWQIERGGLWLRLATGEQMQLGRAGITRRPTRSRKQPAQEAAPRW